MSSRKKHATSVSLGGQRAEPEERAQRAHAASLPLCRVRANSIVVLNSCAAKGVPEPVGRGEVAEVEGDQVEL